jgi:hypothetical protein
MGIDVKLMWDSKGGDVELFLQKEKTGLNPWVDVLY